MAWKIKDEFIDLGRARHVVIYHNPDTGGEHHLIHDFRMPSCPHCGTPKLTADKQPIDFQKQKDEMLQALNDHHRSLMQYREKHSSVRLGSTPK